jgi:hypothetical protein
MSLWPSLLGQDRVTPPAAEALSPYLQPGERLIWSGQPDVWSLLLYRALLGAGGVLFLLIFAAQGAMGEIFDGGAWWLYRLLLLAFMLSCLWLVVLVPLEWLRAPHLRYGVTDRRAIILTCWPWRRARSWSGDALNCLEYSPREDGSGTVYFHRQQIGADLPTRFTYTGFHGVEDVEGAAAALRTLMRT